MRHKMAFTVAPPFDHQRIQRSSPRRFHGKFVERNSKPTTKLTIRRCSTTISNNVSSSRILLHIRSPLRSHEKRFPTLYDLCKIDLPNGRANVASLVTLAVIRGQLWASLNTRSGSSCSVLSIRPRENATYLLCV